jgi:hypothetical protein
MAHEEPLPTWEAASRAAAEQIGELIARLDQPFPEITGDDEGREQRRALECLAEARGILGGQWTHQVPAGLIGLGVNHARRLVLDAGLTVRLGLQGGAPLTRPLGPGEWAVINTFPAPGSYVAQDEEIILALAERGTRRPGGRRV